MAVVPGEHNPEEAPAKNISVPAVDMVPDGSMVDGTKDLRAVRNIRMTLINALGSNINTNDPDSVKLLMSILKDADASALGILRVQLEEKNGDAEQQKRDLANAVIKSITEGTFPGVRNMSVVDVQAREIPTLPDDISSELVPGEMELGTVSQTLDQWKAKMEGREVEDAA